MKEFCIFYFAFEFLAFNKNESFLKPTFLQFDFVWILLSFLFHRHLAEETTQTESRSKRDIDIVIRDIKNTPVTTWGHQFGEGGVCVTAKATFGKCTSFKACYPYFKKIPNLSVFDTWVLGQYDTCTFYTDDGRQAFGVCCVDPPKTNGIASIVPENRPIASIMPVQEDNVIVNKDTVSNWPPPFITHPPNHAAPTHSPTGILACILLQDLSVIFKFKCFSFFVFEIRSLAWWSAKHNKTSNLATTITDARTIRYGHTYYKVSTYHNKTTRLWYVFWRQLLWFEKWKSRSRAYCWRTWC